VALVTSLRGVVDSLFHPATVSRFRREIFGRQPMHAVPSNQRLAGLRSLTSWTPDDLLAAHRADVTAWFQSTNGEHTTAQVSPRAARHLLAGGLTVYLRDAEPLQPLTAAIADALLVPVENIGCSVFCNQPGATTEMHFDGVDTITVQISGSKTWRIARNDHAPNPTSTWIPGEVAPSVELAQYARMPMPTAMPDDVSTFTLVPGSMLYIPRGYWHETESEEASVSLHAHYLTTPWLELVLDTLRARLLREASMRTSVDDLWDPHRRQHLLTAANGALATATEALAELTPDDLVPQASAPPVAATEPMVRRAAAGLRIEQLGGVSARHLVTVVVGEAGAHRETAIELTNAHVAACRRFDDAVPGGLSATDIANEVAGLDVDSALMLVTLLVEAGYLRSASEQSQRPQDQAA
jgi:50S ribosomal protein L16 3-hydroxylase